MGLKITIREIEEGKPAAKPASVGMNASLAAGGEETEETGTVLTDFTVKVCECVTEDMPGRNQFLSGYIEGLLLEGRYNIADRSGEGKNADTLFDWYNKTSHEKETYKKIEVQYLDNNDVPYDRVTFEKAFVVAYREKQSFRDNSVVFHAFIRNFDKTESAVKF